jgi:hypothetical protein
MGLYEKLTEKTADLKQRLSAIKEAESNVQPFINRMAGSFPLTSAVSGLLIGTGKEGPSEGLRQGAQGLITGAGIGAGGYLGSNLASELTKKIVGSNSGSYADAAAIAGGLLGAGGLGYMAHRLFDESNQRRDLQKTKELMDLVKSTGQSK